MVKVAVIGAGVIGLSTAINIQKLIPDVSVTVIADKFLGDTTSIGAGGIFRPTTKYIQGIAEDRVRKWSEDTWRWYSSLALSEMSSVTGHSVMPGYIFSQEKVVKRHLSSGIANTPHVALYTVEKVSAHVRQPSKKPIYADVVFHCRELTSEEISKMNMSHYKYGYTLTTTITLMTKYLPWLMNKFQNNGGIIQEKRINNLAELHGQYDVVVNCTGLGSRDLVNDKTVYPVRGQLVKMHAPWIKFWIYTDDDAYILPNPECVCVGGVRQKDNYSLDVDHQDRVGILQRCLKLWPALQGSTIIGEWVGLRPTRIPVRVEKEIIKLPTGDLKVVHNYGHGANGVTISWGTAIEAAGHVKDLLSPNARL